ncbi:neo-calmodulin-like [Drosophila albomicans]|uniref:Neo-calmodulin-like n=1 Tax=Drosophila albomicans TaxID=7291 RepID=A0A9C6W750_DROAB|nr:neo-calmodulin-like [Drosophila albomicans]
MDPSSEELQEFERAFHMIDQDRVGSFTSKDLGIFMRNLGMKPIEGDLQSMINEIDLDGNGTVEFSEFLLAMSIKMCQMPNDDELRETFRVFDKDNNGFITAGQIRGVFLELNTNLNDEEIDEILREADKDDDGVVSLEDFSKMMYTR